MGTGGGNNTSAATINLTGAGSSFINPLMPKWAQAYRGVAPNVQINYQSIDSGVGQQQFISKTVDFGGTDAQMKDAQIIQAGGTEEGLHIPMTLGAGA